MIDQSNQYLLRQEAAPFMQNSLRTSQGLTKKKLRQLEISDRAQRESARHPKSDWGGLIQGVKIPR